jgi:hypothetical protein
MSDYGDMPISFDFSQHDESFKYDRWLMYRHATQEVLHHLFPGRLQQQHVFAVTGSGPFLESDLLAMLERGGWYEGPSADALMNVEDHPFISEYYLIVGREDFDEGLLDWVIEALRESPDSLLILSQEDFLNDWLFGRYEPYTRLDMRIDEHPGLRYVAEHSGPNWPWPSTEPEPSPPGELDTNGWLLVHPLKGRFGYTVGTQEDLTDAERRRRLDRSLTTPHDPLTLYDVAHHIAGQARLRKKQDPQKYARAIARWEGDLAYLKQKYYKRDFVWPVSD